MEIIAHRGASAYALENSREAITLARRLGADRIELDVRITADNTLVVLHDESLERTTTGKGLLREHRFREIGGVRLKNGEKLLTLEEAMDISGETPLYLDVKEAEALEPLVWTLRRRRTTDLIVASSDDRFLQQFQKRLDIPTSLQLESPEIGGAKRARELGATFVHPCWENFGDPLKLLLKGFLHNFTNAGLKIILWHEENPKALLKARGLGNALYGITTDRPDLAKSILRGGGHGTPP